MKHLPKKLLALLLVLCMILPLSIAPAAAADAEGELPIDYQFEAVSEDEVVQSAEKLSFDPFSSLQWDMKLIGMGDAWESGLTGKGVRVGVIDSGVSNLTMDIPSSRIRKGENFSGASGLFSSTTVDAEGHGTFVAGIIGAARGNGIGIAGMAPDVEFYSVKTLSRDAEAIRACVDAGCKVLNMSFGTPYDNQALREAIQYADANGVILVASIGNDGNAQLQYPAAYPNVIGVGSVNRDKQVSSFSNRNDSVTVVAPGEKVLSLGPAPLIVYRSSGTSFSAPFVTGLAAMLKQAYPQMTNADFLAILQASSEDLGEAGYDTAYGWGLMNAPAAIDAAADYFAAVSGTQTGNVPIDYRFDDVRAPETNAEALNLSFDPFSALQWDMKMIGMTEGWKSGLTGRGVTVGIVDSGLSGITMDIEKSRILEGKNLSPVHLNFGSPVMDTVGHGTFIAGIIGASKGNGVGIAGMAPDVTFAPIKCFSALFTTPDAEISGIYAAADEFGCDVINLSSGSPDQNSNLKNAVRHAIERGAIVISTVGNEGDATLNYPGAYDEVIAVGSVDRNMQISDFSNQNESVFVVAPGENVYSLGRLPMSVTRSSGTSFSAPFVSGLAAMLKQAYPQMTQADFKEILKVSSKDLGEPGYDTVYGWGLIQVPAAIRAAEAYFAAAPDASAAEPELELDPTAPIDQQFRDLDLSAVPQNAEKLSFDPFSALQWDMKMIGMRDGWKSGLTGNGVRVAIIDTGVSTRTGDIDAARLLAGKNLVDGSESTDDSNGHGTFIAGIIGATKGNGVGIAGVAPGVTIVPLKTSEDGNSNTKINSEAIYAAVDEFHCDVINMSIGSRKGTDQLHRAIQYAESKGVIIVCSTGNEGNEVLHYPGAYEETIGVGFVNIASRASSFSHKNESIFVTAPGEAVVSLSCRVPYIARLGAGSSYAAPFVTGLAALLKEKYPEMNKTDFAEILKMSSKDLGDPGYDTTYGWGLIQVPDAIRAAEEYFGDASGASTEQAASSLIDRLRDVAEKSWFYQAVKYVTDRRYMSGTSADTFAPQSLVTRAQVAQILYNMEGKPSFRLSGAFSDTARSAWYYDAVMWAKSTGIVSGMPDGSFRPNAPITREQIAAILHRYVQWKGLDTAASGDAAAGFADFGQVSRFAKAAMQWAADAGILNGDGAGHLKPGSSATRAEIAVMLKKLDSVLH